MFLFVLITQIFVRVSAVKCVEKQQFRLLDCSDMSLRTTDELLSEIKPWVYVIDFKRNLLVWINGTSLLYTFPNLQMIDLRQNPNVDCWRIRELKINGKSDCNTKTVTHQPLLQTISSPVPSTSLTTR